MYFFSRLEKIVVTDKENIFCKLWMNAQQRHQGYIYEIQNCDGNFIRHGKHFATIRRLFTCSRSRVSQLQHKMFAELKITFPIKHPLSLVIFLQKYFTIQSYSINKLISIFPQTN